MSYPSSLDLAFGSEKFTADPFSHLSFGSTNGGGGDDSGLPTTESELQELEQAGMAYYVLMNYVLMNMESGALILSDTERIPANVVETLPENLKGIVTTEDVVSEEEPVRALTYIVNSDPLSIILDPIPSGKGVWVILKNAVNDEP